MEIMEKSEVEKERKFAWRNLLKIIETGFAFSGYLPTSIEGLLTPRLQKWIQAEMRFQQILITKLKYKYDKSQIAINKSKKTIHVIIRKAQSLMDERDRSLKMLAQLKTFHERKNKELRKVIKHLIEERDFARRHYIEVARGHYQVKLRIGWFFRRVMNIFRDFKDWLKVKLAKRYYWFDYKIRLHEVERQYKEIKNLQEAFEYHIADWVEFLNKMGLPEEEILSHTRQFNRLMYWKKPGKKKELVYSTTESKPVMDLGKELEKGEKI